MNSIERIMATLAGESLDRRAFVPVLSLYGAKLARCPLDRYYSDPVAYTEGQVAVRKEFEPDILFGPFAFALIGASFGSDIKWSSVQAPNISRPAVVSLYEWNRLAIPDPGANPHLLYFREAIRRLVTRVEGIVPVAACLPSPIDLPALAMGMERWLDMVLFDQKSAHQVLDKAIPFFVLLANSLFAEGAAMVVLPCAFASPAILMREPVESLMRPALEEAFLQLNGPVVLHHGGAALLEHLDILAGLPKAVGVAINSEEGLARARKVVGQSLVLLSGPQGPSLAGMDASEVKNLCLKILEERYLAKDTRFILATLGADVPVDTPPENLHAMRNALLEVEIGKPCD